MAIVAKLNNIRIAPRKARLVAALIRRKKASEAEAILKFSLNRTAGPMLKLLESAIANAKHNFKIEKDQLYVSKISIDQAKILKRALPRSRGMVHPIRKKMSHIILELEKMQIKKKESK